MLAVRGGTVEMTFQNAVKHALLCISYHCMYGVCWGQQMLCAVHLLVQNLCLADSQLTMTSST
jgi:hypothetical protein